MIRPSVSLIVVGFNQENYIENAVRSALEQDFSPLEIILSDDCSSDRTFGIMEDLVRDYRGPHKVRLNRNSRNLGIVGHVNSTMQLSSGELVVIAAGDDVSFQTRVSSTVDLWEQHCRKPDMLYFSFEPVGAFPLAHTVDPETHDLAYQIRHGGSKVFGSTAAWTRRLFDVFGDMNPRYDNEDKILSFRAALLGGLACKNIPVIKYRLDRDPTARTAIADIHNRLQTLLRRKSYYQAFVEDLETLRLKVPGRLLECNALLSEVRTQQRALDREELIYSGSIKDTIFGLWYLWTGQTWTRRSIKKRASLSRLLLMNR